MCEYLEHYIIQNNLSAPLVYLVSLDIDFVFFTRRRRRRPVFICLRVVLFVVEGSEGAAKISVRVVRPQAGCWTVSFQPAKCAPLLLIIDCTITPSAKILFQRAPT